MRFDCTCRISRIILLFPPLSAAAGAVYFIPNLEHFRDKTGAVATYNSAGDIDKRGAFFESLGTNGRSCVTCHQPDQAFGLSAKGVRELYERTGGRDPLFAMVDGANCPTAARSDRAAHSLLLEPA